jgi:hypothetical protein
MAKSILRVDPEACDFGQFRQYDGDARAAHGDITSFTIESDSGFGLEPFQKTTKGEDTWPISPF